jgi:dihydroorotate dehydrogenase
MYNIIFKPIVFLLEPERAHAVTMAIFKVILRIPGVKRFLKKYTGALNKRVTVFGLEFNNRVGLAAGFDKNAEYIHCLPTLGFGFIEIGTVTPKPQAGNERPRLFRLPKDQALINRMGFNNDGVDVIVERLKHRPKNIVIGGNIGKNKNTPNENAVDDYIICFEKLFDYVDYFVVNVSSPNTPNLRDLQEKEPLKKILNELMRINNSKPQSKPILLKIAPDLSEHQLLDIIEIVNETKISGIIATNTTISRENLKTPLTRINEIGMGGLSGKPIRKKSNEVIQFLSSKSNRTFPIIGVGGIHHPDDALEKIEAGAELIQIYTGFIYEGPMLVKRINQFLSRKGY